MKPVISATEIHYMVSGGAKVTEGIRVRSAVEGRDLSWAGKTQALIAVIMPVCVYVTPSSVQHANITESNRVDAQLELLSL